MSLARPPDPPAGFRWRDAGPGTVAAPALACDRFPLPHGFTGRAGALGRREREAEDLSRLGRASGARALHSLRQVHGNRVRIATGPAAPLRDRPAADALLARTPGVGVAIKSADCFPLLLGDPASGAVAAAHAGWRGTVLGIAREAAEALAREAGAPPERLVALLGPAIRVCCFEVGPEVPAALEEAGHRSLTRPGPRGRPHLDLAAANREQLLAAGLDPARIHDAGLCTRCHPAFYSFRREGRGVGRNWAFAVAGPAAT